MKTIGILGGMGPEATAYFYSLIIRNTRAASDQEHIPVIIWSDPRVPPRTEAILSAGESPVELLAHGARALQKAGADFLVMPCITAHYFLEDFVPAGLPVVNLLEETAAFIRRTWPRLHRVGLLASTGTLKSRIVHEALAAKGIKVLDPELQEQDRLVEAVFGRKGIKAGFVTGPPRTALKRVARSLVVRGAQAIVAGCTEVPLALKPEDLSVPLVDPMEVGALACIQCATSPLRASSWSAGRMTSRTYIFHK